MFARRPRQDMNGGEVRLRHRRVDGVGARVVQPDTVRPAPDRRAPGRIREQPAIAQPGQFRSERAVPVGVDPGSLDPTVPGVAVQVVGELRAGGGRDGVDGDNSAEQHGDSQPARGRVDQQRGCGDTERPPEHDGVEHPCPTGQVSRRREQAREPDTRPGQGQGRPEAWRGAGSGHGPETGRRSAGAGTPRQAFLVP